MRRFFRILLCLLASIILPPECPAVDVPTSVAGRAIVVDYVAGNKNRVLVLKDGSFYCTALSDGYYDSSGTATYTKGAPSKATLKLVASSFTSTFTLSFSSDSAGTFSCADTSSFGTVTSAGAFRIYSGSASTDLSGSVLSEEFDAGQGAFAGVTSAKLKLGQTSYSIASNTGTIYSSGTYTYTQNTPTQSSVFSLSDTLRGGTYSKTLSWDTQTSGAFLIKTSSGTPVASGSFNVLGKPPTITGLRTASLAAVGGSASFSVEATGSTPLVYQWRKDGVAISEATSATYVIESLTALNAGSYSVMVSNACGAVVTAGELLQILNRPRITSQPAPSTVLVDAPTNFSVTASGDEPLSYQWRRNGIDIAGGTSAALAIDAASHADGGTYSVRVSNLVGNVISNEAVLVVQDGPLIVNKPQGTTVNQGSTLFLSVTASGYGPMTYQWSKDGAPLANGTLSSLLLQSVGEADAGSYTVQIRQSLGSTQSAPALVRVTSPVTIDTQPSGLTLSEGESGTLTVGATGTSPFNYQWRKAGKIISGATLSSYQLHNVTQQQAGSYDVVVTNAAGSVTSASAKVSVTPPLSITRSPVSNSAPAGSVLTLSVAAKGAGTLSYQWAKDGIPIDGAFERTYSLGTVNPVSAGTYTVTVTDETQTSFTTGGAVVAVRTDAVATGLLILQQPVDLTIIKGSAAVLPVAVSPAGNATITGCRLFRILQSGNLLPTGITCTVSSGGQLDFPLQNLTAAETDYVLEFTRTSGGMVTKTISQPFRVTLLDGENFAGTYETLLAPEDSQSTDSAKYRGRLTLTLTRTGAFSGRLYYNEAQPLSGAGSLNLRTYVPVVRSFAGRLTPSSGSPLRFHNSPPLGRGPEASRQQLALEINFAAAPTTLQATVTDSVSSTGSWTSVSENGTRIAPEFPETLKALQGKYTLATTGTSETLGYIMLQVTSAGRLLWVSRIGGFLGTGAATVNASTPDAPSAELYQYRNTSTASLLSTNSLLGRVAFALGSDNYWRPFVEAQTLEQQGSYVSRASGSPDNPAVYQQAAFDGFKNKSGITTLDFEDSTFGRWAATSPQLYSSFFLAQIPMRLLVEDPDLTQSDGSPAALEWLVTRVNSTGFATAQGVAGPLGTPPALRLRLNPLGGEFLGTYSIGARKRSLIGIAVGSEANPYQSGRGWSEMGAYPNLQQAPWTLEIAH